MIIDLIYLLATWHALAKLSVHTDTSLHLLDTTTTTLGAGLRHFVGVICPKFNTVETNSEYSKRYRRGSARATQKTSDSAGRQPKTLSLKTIKLHFLGDYVACIRSLGPTDGYTSGIVCIDYCIPTSDTEGHNSQGEHRHHWVKQTAQTRTNNRDTDRQLGEMDYICFHLNRIADELRAVGVPVSGETPPPPPAVEAPQETEATISTSHKSSTYLPGWLNDHRRDPALMVPISSHQSTASNSLTPQGFMDSLLIHLRDRLFPDGDSTEPLFIQNNTLYNHPILTINYTSYDLQRKQDIIHLGYSREGIMVYTPTLGGDEPWSYAKILAIYHVVVRTASDPEPKRLTALWVRWMERSTSGLIGLNSQNYTQVSFVPWSGVPGTTFDFIDPSHIIRGCHLLPAFALGRTHDLLDPSIARDREGDWRAYYANRYGLVNNLI